ncbi:MAG TPA: tRNA pseudouridine(13) synthase TruD [Thiolapillus brandeum]|uniref:tRNA pseudouridine synthase D n=1 Tax=Thiolapillus brandeum TaxID=1076588 RepID=A0A831K363_9GAMM|nr:tRNA pseudouridine(13) synthase TruD [Thiolapillus brandeum]
MTDPVRDLPRAWGGTTGTGVLRSTPEDFQVIEDLGVDASGSGEHVLLKIRKRNLNTTEVAGHIARLAGIRARDVSYAGLKDRMAVATQTFSVHLPGREDPDWCQLEGDNLQVLEASRHHRKLRRGTLRGNRFKLVIREFAGDQEILEQRLQQIAQHGVPNYFGSQRFGREGNNLQRAQALFSGELKKVRRDKRSIWLSAARSWLFNQVLAARVFAASWNTLLGGDVMQVAGGRGQFMAEAGEAELLSRLEKQEVHVTGPLCGKPGRALQAEGQAAELEQKVLASEQSWIEGLQRFGLEADRRALGLKVNELQWQIENDVLELDFGLVSGSYATVVVRELVKV